MEKTPFFGTIFFLLVLVGITASAETPDELAPGVDYDIGIAGSGDVGCDDYDKILTGLDQQYLILKDIHRKVESCASCGCPAVESTTPAPAAPGHCGGPFPADCAEILAAGGGPADTPSGTYAIQPDDGGDPFFVYCDMDTAGGGWTVFQRRQDGSVDFFRDYRDYKAGFGSVAGEHWLGNENLHRMTSQKLYKLRVDLEDFDGAKRYAEYTEFVVADDELKYKVMVEKYSGDAGDSLSPMHDGMMFSTSDVDNDLRTVTPSCAEEYKGGWWYNKCHQTNLNGQYRIPPAHDPCPFGRGVTWVTWRGQSYSLKKAEMKLIPRY